MVNFLLGNYLMSGDNLGLISLSKTTKSGEENLSALKCYNKIKCSPVQQQKLQTVMVGLGKKNSRLD
jgi:hypothetical protein